MAILARTDPRGKPLFVVVVNYRDHSGRRRQKRKNARSPREAERVERDLLNQRDALALPDQKPPSPVKQRLTVSEYLDEWLDGRQGLNQSTAKRYRELLDPAKRIVGAMALADLTTLDVRRVYDSILAAGRSPKTALNTHRVLKTAMQNAVDVYGEITRNPVIKDIAPKSVPFEAYRLTRDDIQRIFEAADAYDAARRETGGSSELGTIIRLAAWTGLRLGELLALTWSDLDLEARCLTVRRTLSTTGSMGRPKTPKSRRTIGISPETVTILADLRTNQQVKRKRVPLNADEDYVFADVLGNPITQDAVGRAWATSRSIPLPRGAPVGRRGSGTRREGIAPKAGVPRARFHDLRHAHAAHLLADGWEVTVVSERLGHSQVSVTLNTYSYALPNRSAAMADAVDRIFGGS